MISSDFLLMQLEASFGTQEFHSKQFNFTENITGNKKNRPFEA
jgi:hypothetical protein